MPNDQPVITIHVSGAAGVGKSAFAQLIAEHLKFLGYQTVQRGSGVDTPHIRAPRQHQQVLSSLRERSPLLVVHEVPLSQGRRTPQVSFRKEDTGGDN